MLFGFPVFVVWWWVTNNNGEPKFKSRVVVNLYGLNKITIPDSYPLPRQEDII
jgi:hypothetical protein